MVDRLYTQLHAWDRRILPEAIRIDLIDRGPRKDIRTAGLLGVRLRQEYCARTKVVTPDLIGFESFCHANVGITDDRESIPPLLERAECACCQIEIPTDVSGVPEVLTRAPFTASRGSMDQFYRHESRWINDRAGDHSACRHHCIKKRECNRSTHTPEEGASLNLGSGNEIHFVRPISSSNLHQG